MPNLKSISKKKIVIISIDAKEERGKGRERGGEKVGGSEEAGREKK